MRDVRPRGTGSSIAAAALLAMALAVIAFERPPEARSNSKANRQFQRAVCGLGIGSSLRPDWGFITYDARIDATDETVLWPIPGGYAYSPERAMMGDDVADVQ